MAVAHALGHADDIRHHALLFEAPKVMTQTAITHLHLIGNAYTTRSANLLIHLLQIAGRQGNPARIAIHRLADEARHLPLLLCQRDEYLIDTAHILRRTVGATKRPAIGIGCGDRMHPIRAGTECLRVVGNRGGNGVGRHRPAVICLQHTQHVASAAVGPGQPDCQVVGLGAAVDQKHAVHALGCKLEQALGELGNRRVMKARVGVEQRPLTSRFMGHARVVVAEDRDVIEHVQIGTALHVDQVIAPATLDLRRSLIVVFLRAGEAGITPRQQLRGVCERWSVTIKTEQGRRRRAHGAPGCRPGRCGEQRRAEVCRGAQLQQQRTTALPDQRAY